MKQVVKSMLVAGVLMLVAFALPSAASALKFQVPSSGVLTTGTDPLNAFYSSAVGDFNGDEVPDIAATTGANGIYVFLSDGDGSFTQAEGSPFAVGVISNRIWAGYFDGDQYSDIIVGDNGDALRTFLSDEGAFTNTPAATFTVPAPGIAPEGDPISNGALNDDFNTDLAIGLRDHSVAIALGNGTGGFTFTPESPIQFPVPTGGDSSDNVRSTAIGQFDGVGGEDIAMAVKNEGTFIDADAGIYGLVNNGDAEFDPADSNPILLKPGVQKIASLDLGYDGKSDLVATIRDSTDNLRTFLGDATDFLVPNPAPNANLTIYPTFSHTLATGDFNDDSNTDVVVNGGSEISVALTTFGENDETAGLTLAPGSPFALPSAAGGNGTPQLLMAGDFDDAGATDIAAMSGSTSQDPSIQARAIYPLMNVADISVSPSSVDFGEVRAGDEGQVEVEIKNEGAVDGTFAPEGVEITTSGDPDDFGAQLDTDEGCGGGTIESEETCIVDVEFLPGSPGIKTGTLTIEFTNPSQSFEIPLTGTAVEPGITVDPGSIEFGEAVLGTPKTQTVTIESDGTAPLEVYTPEVSGTDSADFEVVDDATCDAVIPIGQSCTVDVEFDPATAGAKTATLTIYSDGQVDELEVPLTGTGVTPVSSVSLTPTSHDFGEATIGSGGTPAFTFYLEATGNAPVQVNAVSAQATDSNPRSFAVSENGCDGTLQPGATCPIQVIFNPVDGPAGQRTGKIVVDTANGSVESAITGTAKASTPPGKPKLRLKLKLPKKVKAGKTVTVTATVTNVGTAKATGLKIKTKVAKKLAKAPKVVRVQSLAVGKSVKRKLKIKVKKGARGRMLTATVVASAPGSPNSKASRPIKVR